MKLVLKTVLYKCDENKQVCMPTALIKTVLRDCVISFDRFIVCQVVCHPIKCNIFTSAFKI